MKDLIPKALYQTLYSELVDNDRSYRVLSHASYLDRALGDVRSFQASLATNTMKFFFDLMHIVCFRNALVHESKFFAEEYYVEELAQLFRSVIAFRLACADALDSEGVRELFPEDNKDDACFAFCMKLLALDSERVSEGQPVWLGPAGIQSLHKAGWGFWAAFKLGDLVRQFRSKKQFLAEYEPPPVDVTVADTMELL